MQTNATKVFVETNMFSSVFSTHWLNLINAIAHESLIGTHFSATPATEPFKFYALSF